MSRLTRASVLMGAVILLVPEVAARAQGPYSAVTFGIVGALNVSRIGGSDATGFESRTGYTIGALVRKRIDTRWTFQGEVEYTMKGAKASFLGLTQTLNLSYIEVPLLIRAYASAVREARPFLEFGPAIAFKAGCTVTPNAITGTGSDPCSEFGAVNSFDYGLMGGGGIEFPLGARTFEASVRYNLGLPELGDGGNLKNRNLQFVLGIHF